MPPVIYKDHRGNRLPSVTTIIGRFKESGGLLYWANQQGLEGKTLDQARAEVTTPGTLAHKAVEDHINGRPETALAGAGEVTEKARNAYAAYLNWEAMNRITFRHTEVALASEQYAFGGTLDAVGMIGNELILLDWKCANAVYADYLYQLAAYGLLWNDWQLTKSRYWHSKTFCLYDRIISFVAREVRLESDPAIVIGCGHKSERSEREMTKIDAARADLAIALELAVKAQNTLTDENEAMRRDRTAATYSPKQRCRRSPPRRTARCAEE